MVKKGFAVLSIVVLGLATVISLGGCQGEVSFTTASLSDATMCRSVDPETRKPVDTANVFSPDTPEIHCSVKLSNAPDETEVTSQWIYVQGEVEGLKNHKIAEYTLTSEDTGYLSFSLTPSEKGFPRGEYLVRLSIEGEEKLNVPFSVQ